MKRSIEKISNSTYRLRYPIGTLPNGNPDRISKVVKAKTDKEAYMELAKWNIDIEKKGYSKLNSITFKNFFENNWKKEAKINLEEKTYEEYESIIESRFIKKLGNKKLTDIKPYEIKELVINVSRLDGRKGNVSRQRKKRILSALSNVFIVAIDEYRIITENPCNSVRIPKEKNVEIHTFPPYTTTEITELFKILKDAPLRTQAIIMSAITTGARQGEIAALEERHFNFSTNEVTFDQRIIALKEGLKRKDGLKSSNSKTMTVPEQYLNVIKEQIELNDQDRHKLNIDKNELKHLYIFGHPDGKPITPISLNRHWRRFADTNALRYIRFHDFRHTSATFLIGKNTPVKNVQERLGHKDFSTTMNIYSHALKEIDEKASDEFSSFF